MLGLSAFRVAHSCCPSFSGRSRLASPAPPQHLLLLGFQQQSSFFKCGREAFAPASRRLKTAAQDEAATEDGLPPLEEEEVSTKLAEEDVPTNSVAVEEGPKVKVKFILEKKCHFGQRFNVVGSHPLFGNWDVEAAIPMEWAEGDIWTAEVDVPAEKQVEFKFVMTGESVEIEWQPGSNRVFNTIEGISPLVVNEAWTCADDVAAQEAAGGESSDLVEDKTLSETDGILVPADIIEDATKDEVVKALESNNGADVPKLEPETAPEIPLPELEVVGTAVKTAPEIPLPELEVVGTAVKTALGVDDAA